MSIEEVVSLDALPDAGWLAVLDEHADSRAHGGELLQLSCSPLGLERARQALLALRAQGAPAVLLLQAKNTLLDDEELGALFTTLRDWDQLTLRNFLELCQDWIPQEYHPALQAEARTEWKWICEWQTAAHDPRLHKYPSLPWRSFIRRINAENYAFVVEFLELIAAPSTPENRGKLEAKVRELLEQKKKAVCIFPKRKVRPEVSS